MGLQRGAFIVFTLAVLGVLGFITYEQLEKPIPHIFADEAGADAAPEDAAPEASADVPDSAALAMNLDAGFSLLGMQLDAGESPGSAMPTDAPRSVKMGVVLVQFAGAEGSSSSRSKADALKRARELMDQAKTDFKGAVKAGDQGSSEDIGRMPRGVLEQPTEVAVFSLAAGEVSDPLETPRGYWVVKRLE